ncbi:hypothetical protein GE09DRAFT_1249665 [Coniochaeta sp. 2T2.1]|nr:hypothetical protein GE09DRAFT_1249665 [Coniochaeta sp. 2T2.1]
MSLADTLYPTETLARLISQGNVEDKRAIFQILDSYTFYYGDHKTLPAARALPLEGAKLTVAYFIEGFMASRYPYEWADELIGIEALRPDGPRLPPLHPTDTGSDNQDAPAATHTEESLPAKDNVEVETYEQAMALDEKLHDMNNRKGITAGIGNFQGFPSTPKEQKAYIDRLVDAMADCTTPEEPDELIDDTNASATVPAASTLDDDNTASGTVPAIPAPKENYQVQRAKHTSRKDLQILAWKLLEWAIASAQGGLIFMPDRYGGPVKYNRYDDFDERFNAVCNALRKGLVNDLMAWDPFRRLAAAPAKERSRNLGNKEGNLLKQKRLAAGKQVMPPAAKRRRRSKKDSKQDHKPEAEGMVPNSGTQASGGNQLGTGSGASQACTMLDEQPGLPDFFPELNEYNDPTAQQIGQNHGTQRSTTGGGENQLFQGLYQPQVMRSQEAAAQFA